MSQLLSHLNHSLQKIVAQSSGGAKPALNQRSMFECIWYPGYFVAVILREDKA